VTEMVRESNCPQARLSISKVAVGCASLDALQARQAARASGGEVPLVTRFMPKRAEELLGGSVYWIVKHRIQARQTILGFGERPDDRKTVIRLAPELVPVRPVPRRAHQGWRYLPAGDCPTDLIDMEPGLALPGKLLAELSALFLI
jgi:hypothetical protein